MFWSRVLTRQEPEHSGSMNNWWRSRRLVRNCEKQLQRRYSQIVSFSSDKHTTVICFCFGEAYVTIMQLFSLLPHSTSTKHFHTRHVPHQRRNTCWTLLQRHRPRRCYERVKSWLKQTLNVALDRFCSDVFALMM